MKINLRFIIAVLLVIITYSCQEDDYFDNHSHIIGHNLKSSTINYERLSSNNKVYQLTNEMVVTSQFKSNFSSNNIIIDTTNIQVLESEFYKSYAFQIVQDSLDRKQLLKNYILTVFNDSLIQQMIVEYPIVNNEYDITNAIITPYDGNSLYQLKNMSTVPEFIEWVVTCVDFRCTAGGEHLPGDSRCKATGSEKAYTSCKGAWVSRFPNQGGDINPNDPMDTDRLTGGSPNTNPVDSDKNDRDVIGITPNDGNNIILTPPDKECEKIANNLKSTDSTSVTALYKEKLQQMADSVDIYTAEVSYGMFENDAGFDRYVGTPGGGDNASLLVEPTSPYTAFGHVHNDDSIGTLSVFSIDDLLAFAEGVSNNAINTNKFTAFLSTHHGADGQHFALTISNVSKFRAFFNSQFPYTAPSNYTDQQSATHQQLLDQARMSYLFTIQKFWGDANPLISNTATDVDDQLKKFMQFLDEADMGVEVFKTDKNFDNFKKLSYDSTTNQIKEKSC